MFKNFQLPPIKGTDLFPDVMQPNTIVRLRVHVEVLNEDSSLDAAWLKTVGYRIATAREGDIVNYLLSQRQLALLADRKIYKTSRRFDKELTLIYRRSFDYEQLEIEITVSEEEGIDDKGPDELCLLVLYNGNRIAAISQKSLTAWDVRYKKALKYSFGTEVLPMSQYRFNSRKDPCVYYGAFYLSAETGRITRSNHYWFSRTSYEYPFNEFYESTTTWSFQYASKVSVNTLIAEPQYLEIDDATALPRSIHPPPIINGGANKTVYTPSESYFYGAKQLSRGQSPGITESIPIAIDAEGWHYYSHGINWTLSNSAQSAAYVPSTIWSGCLPSAAYDKFYAQYQAMGQVNIVDLLIWSRVKSGDVQVNWDATLKSWTYDGQEYHSEWVKTTASLDMPISVFSQADGVDYLNVKLTPATLAVSQDPPLIVKRWEWFAMYTWLYGSEVREDGSIVAYDFLYDPAYIEHVLQFQYSAGAYITNTAPGATQTHLDFLNWSVDMTNNPNYYQDTDSNGQPRLYKGYSSGNEALINYVSFPPSLSTYKHYATMYKWTFEDTYGGTYPSPTNTSRISRTPYFIEQSQSQTFDHLFGWLHASNGQHYIQGFIASERSYIYIDSQDAKDRIGAYLGCAVSDIQAMVLDVPLFAIKKIA